MFTVICNKCGSKDIFISGGYDGDYMFSCQKCDNVGSDMDGTLTINDGTFDPTPPVQPEKEELSEEEIQEISDMLKKMKSSCESISTHLDGMNKTLDKLEVIK